MSKPKLEVTLCFENYKGKVTRYLKRDRSHAENDALWYRAYITKETTFPIYYVAVWIEEREIAPWTRIEGSETRR